MADQITLPRAVVQQALEALENAEDQLAKPYSTDASNAITALRAALAQAEPVEPVACSNTFGCRCPKHFAAQQAEPVQPEYGSTDCVTFAGLPMTDGDRRLAAMLTQAFGADHPAIHDLVALLFAARGKQQAEPVQEPVAWRVRRRSEKFWNVSQHKPLDAMQDDRFEVRALVDAVDQQQAESVQEPVAECKDDGEGGVYYVTLSNRAPIGPLYTAPQQRKPLTEEEIDGLMQSIGLVTPSHPRNIGAAARARRRIARAVEAMLTAREAK